jgi:tRNA threonylcarbamoyladenosine biosynthesis protein TsaB
MNLLAIETSSPFLSVAVKKSAGKIRHASVKGYMKHAENLLPVIDRLLKKEKLKIGDIDAFLIGRGPGSFTGLRIGFATLKGFLAIRPKPCYGAFSLDVIAAGIHPLQRPGLCSTETGSLQGAANLAVCLDAKRGKLYACFYRYRDGKWLPRKRIEAYSLEAVIEETTEGSLIAGDGILADKCGTMRHSGKQLVFASERSWYPKASTLIDCFERKNFLLQKLTKPEDMLPFYLRFSEPEEKLRDAKRSR